MIFRTIFIVIFIVIVCEWALTYAVFTSCLLNCCIKFISHSHADIYKNGMVACRDVGIILLKCAKADCHSTGTMDNPVMSPSAC